MAVRASLSASIRSTARTGVLPVDTDPRPMTLSLLLLGNTGTVIVRAIAHPLGRIQELDFSFTKRVPTHNAFSDSYRRDLANANLFGAGTFLLVIMYSSSFTFVTFIIFQKSMQGVRASDYLHSPHNYGNVCLSLVMW